MKRMHVHIAVDDLGKNVAFYSQLFGSQPTVQKPDYAKWMLDDPRINFAISARGAKPGLDHLGFQVDSDDELVALKERLEGADMAMLTETGTTCCYAKSDKHWVMDPSGIPWETYHTLDSAPTFNDQPNDDNRSACCAPTAQKIEFSVRKRSDA